MIPTDFRAPTPYEPVNSQPPLVLRAACRHSTDTWKRSLPRHAESWSGSPTTQSSTPLSRRETG
jgi:hypothetical protein